LKEKAMLLENKVRVIAPGSPVTAVARSASFCCSQRVIRRVLLAGCRAEGPEASAGKQAGTTCVSFELQTAQQRASNTS
jgi:hypothetical protein